MIQSISPPWTKLAESRERKGGEKTGAHFTNSQRWLGNSGNFSPQMLAEEFGNCGLHILKTVEVEKIVPEAPG